MYNLNDIFYEDADYTRRVDFCDENGYVIQEIEPDENGRRFQIQLPPEPTEEEIKSHYYYALKSELEKVMEDIAQEQLGLVREDFAEKKARAAEIINELRVLEGKEPREVKTE